MGNSLILRKKNYKYLVGVWIYFFFFDLFVLVFFRGYRIVLVGVFDFLRIMVGIVYIL